MDEVMKIRASFTVLALSLFSPFALNAQIVLRSVEEAQTFALKNNSGNKVQQLKTMQASQNKRTANAFLFPNISAGASGQYNIDVQETPVPGELLGKSNETVYLKFGKSYNYTAGINVNYNLLNWTSLLESKTVAAQFSLQQANQSYYEQGLRQQTSQSYYAVVISQQAIGIWKQNLAVADSIKELTRKKFAEGIVDQLSLNQAEINVKNVKQQLDKAQLFCDQCYAELKTLLSVADSVSLSISEKQGFTPLQEDDFQLLPDRESEVYKSQVLVSDYQMKSARSAFLPQVSLKGYWGSYNYSDDFGLSLGSASWKPSSYIGLSVSMPIFTGFANKSKYNAAKVQKLIASENYEEAVRNRAVNDSQLWKEYFSAERVANLSLERLHLSQQNMALALQKYQEGLTGLSDYLDTFNSNLSIQNEYLTNVSQFRMVQSELDARR